MIVYKQYYVVHLDHSYLANIALTKDGAFIFKGECRAERGTDWLKLELEEWKKRVEHDERTQTEAEQYI